MGTRSLENVVKDFRGLLQFEEKYGSVLSVLYKQKREQKNEEYYAPRNKKKR